MQYQRGKPKGSQMLKSVLEKCYRARLQEIVHDETEDRYSSANLAKQQVLPQIWA